MKNTFLIALFLLTGVASADPRTPIVPPPPIDLVFDLDWTLLSTIDEHSVVGDDSKVFTIGGTRYRISDGVVESLNLLRRFPHVRLSYFSGGSAERNEAALRRIVLDQASGLSAWDVMTKKLNFEHLEDLFPSDASVKFRAKYRKKLAPYFENIDRVILIDDVKEFAAAGESGNMLYIGATYNFIETLADVFRLRARGDPSELPYLPENGLEWEIERNRIPVTTLALERAILDDVHAVGGTRSFLTRVAEKTGLAKETLLVDSKSRFPLLFPCLRLLHGEAK